MIEIPIEVSLMVGASKKNSFRMGKALFCKEQLLYSLLTRVTSILGRGAPRKNGKRSITSGLIRDLILLPIR